MNQTSYELVRQGVSLALEAHRRGLLDDRVLDAILQHYDAEGAVEPFPPAEVLERLGGLTAAQVRELLGGPARTPSDVQGQRFGDRLTLLEPLGAGGMGMVYRAYDRVLKRAVAVKRLRTDHLDKAGAGRVLARFEREAMAMARVRHPACVQIFDAGLTPSGEPYLVMELVTGRSLREVIEDDRARSALAPRRVAQWGAALADALQACHDVGLIHRDVKPANILLDAAGAPRLTDFGVALDDQARTRLTADKGMVGTLAYMSPEQAMGGAVDARSDVYALGATLYEVLTGSPPFDGPGAAHLLRQVLSEEPAPVRRRRPATPADLETIVHTCLAKSVADRYATAQALALDLRRFLADEPVLARATSPGRRLARRVWRARRPLGAALLIGALAGAGLLATRVRARPSTRARVDAALGCRRRGHRPRRGRGRRPAARRGRRARPGRARSRGPRRPAGAASPARGRGRLRPLAGGAGPRARVPGRGRRAEDPDRAAAALRRVARQAAPARGRDGARARRARRPRRAVRLRARARSGGARRAAGGGRRPARAGAARAGEGPRGRRPGRGRGVLPGGRRGRRAQRRRAGERAGAAGGGGALGAPGRVRALALRVRPDGRAHGPARGGARPDAGSLRGERGGGVSDRGHGRGLPARAGPGDPDPRREAGVRLPADRARVARAARRHGRAHSGGRGAVGGAVA
ncbi:MAG: serine/threonine protein kinase [Planctomycetes bacterium]|nr:serine/threonine protein kinase [Planctomycetota bacterium]